MFDTVNLSAIIAQIITAIATLVPLLFYLKYSRLNENNKIKETKNKSESTVNVKITTRIFSPTTKDIASNQKVLEIRVTVKNISKGIVSIPAVYVQIKPFEFQKSENLITDFYDLMRFNNPLADNLNKVKNVAYVKNSIIQLQPGETERYVRWDAIHEDIINESPIIIVNAEVYGASGFLLGELLIPKKKKGKYRDKWIDFMNSEEGIKNNYDIFKRFNEKSPYKWLEKRDRILIKMNEDFDFEKSREFKPVLDSIRCWSRHITVDLTK